MELDPTPTIRTERRLNAKHHACYVKYHACHAYSAKAHSHHFLGHSHQFIGSWGLGRARTFLKPTATSFYATATSLWVL